VRIRVLPRLILLYHTFDSGGKKGAKSREMDEKSIDRIILFVLVEIVWGFAWAAVLQHTSGGRRLAARRTWIAVVVGVGVTVLLLLLVVDLTAILWTAFAFVLSGIGIIIRSERNELELEEVLGCPDSSHPRTSDG